MLYQGEMASLLSGYLGLPDWVQDITHNYDQTPWIRDLLTKIVVQATSDPNYQLKGGLLRFQNRVVTGDDDQLKRKIL